MKQILFYSLMLTFAFAVCSSAQTDSKKPTKAPEQVALTDGASPELVKEAGTRAINRLLEEFLSQKDLSPKRFAVLPMDVDVDGSYFTGKVRDRFAVMGKSNGFELYTRMDDEWAKILDEIAFGQRQGDTMTPESIQKFGRIAGVQGLMMGRVVSVVRDGNDVRVRFSLRAFEVETGRLLWGSEITEYGRTSAAERTILDKVDPQSLPRYILIGLGILVAVMVIRFIGKTVGSARRPR